MNDKVLRALRDFRVNFRVIYKIKISTISNFKEDIFLILIARI